MSTQIQRPFRAKGMTAQMLKATEGQRHSSPHEKGPHRTKDMAILMVRPHRTKGMAAQMLKATQGQGHGSPNAKGHTGPRAWQPKC